MKLNKMEKLEWKEVTDQGARKTRIKILLGEAEGAPNFIMRVFEIEPGGNSPRHQHSWEHEVFILSGRGIALIKGKEYPLEPEDALLIEPNEDHQIQNPFAQPLRFICLIPKIK